MEAFKDAVDHHDVTFDYSDDSAVRRRGSDQLRLIREMAKSLPQDKVAEVWNAKMDYMFTKDEAPRWYWKA